MQTNLIIERLRMRCAELKIDSKTIAQEANLPYSVAQVLLGEVLYNGDLLTLLTLGDVSPLCETLKCEPRWFLFGSTRMRAVLNEEGA